VEWGGALMRFALLHFWRRPCKPKAIASEEFTLGFGLKRCRGARLKVWQGLKPKLLSGAFFGMTEVMPCYKARFDGLFVA